MSEQSVEFVADVEDLFRRHFRAFAKYVDMNWKAEADADLTPEQAEGWNRCCESLGTAYECWTEEFFP